MAIGVVSNGFSNAESLQIFCNNLWVLRQYWELVTVEIDNKVRVNFFLEFCDVMKLY